MGIEQAGVLGEEIGSEEISRKEFDIRQSESGKVDSEEEGH